MTESTIVVAIGAGIALMFSICMWRMVGGMVAMSGSSRRSAERERHDLLKMSERLLEKLTCDADKTARLHASERQNESRMRSHMESDALAAQAPGDDGDRGGGEELFP